MGADRITRGPLNAAGTNPYDQEAVVLDVVNGVLEASGDDHQVRTARTVLQALSAQTALTAITTAQTLISRAFAAGAISKTNRTIRVSGMLIYTTPGTTTPVLTITLLIGGVSLCVIATAALSSTASTNLPVRFSFEATVVTTGSAATIESHGKVEANISANTPAAAGAVYLDTNVAVSSAVNLAAAATLQVKVSADLAITSIQLRQALIEIL